MVVSLTHGRASIERWARGAGIGIVFPRRQDRRLGLCTTGWHPL
ncbi:hypothetical protein [Klebsiella michiganensis]|nr:hypothetical protein [Klebsiella michiganensis]